MNCIVCLEEITRNSTVLFHCACYVIFCKSCVVRQISSQDTTYHNGVTCPICRSKSQNILNVEKCKELELSLVERAARFVGIRKSRHEHKYLVNILTRLVSDKKNIFFFFQFYIFCAIFKQIFFHVVNLIIIIYIQLIKIAAFIGLQRVISFVQGKWFI